MRNLDLRQAFKICRQSIRAYKQKKRNVFTSDFDIAEISHSALSAAENIRGHQRPPAIIIHGVMPRSGTVYTGELLRLHPDVYAYPNDLWEIPFLELTGDFLDIQKKFFDRYKSNKEYMHEQDLLPLFGASLIAYLYSFVPEGKTLLIKVPDVQFLAYFPNVFPFERLLLLMRDGRDLVSSTVRTWPGKNFSKVCSQWQDSAKHMLEFDRFYNNKGKNFHLVKYEEILEQPQEFVRNACERYDLDFGEYPIDEIKQLAFRGSSSIQQEGRVSWDPVKGNKNTKPVGHWREWSAKEIAQFKKIAGAILIDAGYCADLDW